MLNNLLTTPQVMNSKTTNTFTGTEENDLLDSLGIGSARRDREFQAYMSNTTYQRAVKDMEAAGLNPGLMYGSGSGASTPTGGSASTGKMLNNVLSIASLFSNTAKVMKAVNDITTDKKLAENAINISKRIGFR